MASYLPSSIVSPYSICPGFWKTTCQLSDAHTAHTPECAEPWRYYSADGVFTDQQYDRTQSTGYTDGHGAILGYNQANRAGSWTGSLILTSFQGGWPALGYCDEGTNTYRGYQHNRGFMLWIGGPQKQWTLTNAAQVGSTISKTSSGSAYDSYATMEDMVSVSVQATSTNTHVRVGLTSDLGDNSVSNCLRQVPPPCELTALSVDGSRGAQDA